MTTPEASTFGATVVPAQYQSQVLASAARWGISPAVLAAQIDAESSFNPNAVSAAGAVGIAQFLPSTAKGLGVDPKNPNAAIDGMAQLDSINLKKFGNLPDMLAAYNAGAGAVEQYDGVPPYAETQNYVKKILAAAGSALSTPGGADVLADNPVSDVADIASWLDKIEDPMFWKRVGFGALGAAVLLAGVYFFVPKQAGSYLPKFDLKENIP